MKSRYAILNYYAGEVQGRLAFLLFVLDELAVAAFNKQRSEKEVLEFLDTLERTALYFATSDIDLDSHIELTTRGYIVIGGSKNDVYDMAPVYLLMDTGGNDKYFGCFAHGDQGVSVLLDFAGNDFFKCDNRNGSFGSGVSDGVGVLFDLSGNDQYWSKGNSQGSGAATRSQDCQI